MHLRRLGLESFALVLALASFASEPANAFTVQVQSGDFSSQTNVYSGVTGFSISIEVLGFLRSGVYSNPELGDIEFLVQGSLDPTTPARTANPAFTGFAVEDIAALSGQDFYDLGNSLSFEIARGSDLSDGLQVSELVGTGSVFQFDGRELGTGRYHPPIFELFSDGSGSLQNSNNTGGINPLTGAEVNASIGDEYVTELGFTPSTFTLAVPEPGVGLMLWVSLAGLSLTRRRALAASSPLTMRPPPLSKKQRLQSLGATLAYSVHMGVDGSTFRIGTGVTPRARVRPEGPDGEPPCMCPAARLRPSPLALCGRHTRSVRFFTNRRPLSTEK